jgi:hypothetical protein
MKKFLASLLLAAFCWPSFAAPLPDNMTITANGDYDIATVPGGRYLITFSNSFGGATIDVQRKASDGNYYDYSEHIESGQVDFRTAGYGARLHVTNATGGTFIVLTLANIPGSTTDDAAVSLTAGVSGILPVANGGWGTDTGSFTSPTIALNTSSNGNITLAPNGTGITTTAGRLTVTNATASSSTSTGAAVFTGGVGIGGNLHINGSITALNSSTTYGNLTVGPTGFVICSARGGFKATAANEVEIIGSGYSTPASLMTYNGYKGSEMTAPSAPAANGYHIYAEDNGSGKTRLMVRFATGAAQQIAIEP